MSYLLRRTRSLDQSTQSLSRLSGVRHVNTYLLAIFSLRIIYSLLRLKGYKNLPKGPSCYTVSLSQKLGRKISQHLLLLVVWQYGLWSFQTRSTKLERFLTKNQHTQRKLLNFENWINGEQYPMFLQHKSNQNMRLSRLKLMSQSIGSERKTYVINPCFDVLWLFSCQ